MVLTSSKDVKRLLENYFELQKARPVVCHVHTAMPNTALLIKTNDTNDDIFGDSSGLPNAFYLNFCKCLIQENNCLQRSCPSQIKHISSESVLQI